MILSTTAHKYFMVLIVGSGELHGEICAKHIKNHYSVIINTHFAHLT